MGNSHDTITTAARKAVLSWFAKRQTEAPAVEAQLLEDMCLGDLADLQEYVRERYGADAEAHLRAGITCGSQVPIEMVGVISDKQFARQQSTEILLSVPDPVFVEAVGAARRAMCATYEAVGGSALTQEADDYIQRVFARHGIPTELLDVSAAVAAGSSEDSPPTLVDDATDLALDLFGTRWRHITVKAVETFLNRTTDHEPLTWESKGTALPKQRDDVAKWVAGFANRDGGYLILGFDHNDALGLWEQAPIEFPDAEPATWLSRIIRDNCSPTPEFDVRVLSPASAGGLVLVQVQANIGFLTLVNRRIAERQPGETVWLKDGPSVQRAQRRVDARSRSRPTPRVNATAGPDTPRAPASARPHISDDLPPEEFVANLRQLLQNAGDSDLAVFLAGADERVTDARDAGDLNHLAVQLDRLADCAAVTLAYEPTPGTFAQCIAVLRAAFDIGIGRIGRQNGALSGEQLWVEILGRVRALGGLAVRLKRWDAMKLLILQEVHEDAHRLWPFWFRYGDTWANRSRLYQVDNNVLDDVQTAAAPRRRTRLAPEQPPPRRRRERELAHHRHLSLRFPEQRAEHLDSRGPATRRGRISGTTPPGTVIASARSQACLRSTPRPVKRSCPERRTHRSPTSCSFSRSVLIVVPKDSAPGRPGAGSSTRDCCTSSPRTEPFRLSTERLPTRLAIAFGLLHRRSSRLLWRHLDRPAQRG